MKTDIDVSGRIIHISNVGLEVAYLKDKEVKTFTIYGDYRDEFKVGDLINYTEKITIERISDKQKVPGPPNPPRGSRPDVG